MRGGEPGGEEERSRREEEEEEEEEEDRNMGSGGAVGLKQVEPGHAPDQVKVTGHRSQVTGRAGLTRVSPDRTSSREMRLCPSRRSSYRSVMCLWAWGGNRNRPSNVFPPTGFLFP